MSTLLGWTGATVGSAVGWWAGTSYGMFTSFILSMVGTGLGLYLGRRMASRFLD